MMKEEIKNELGLEKVGSGIPDADCIESALKSFKVCLTVITQIVDESGCILHHFLAAVDLAVDHPQRILLAISAALSGAVTPALETPSERSTTILVLRSHS